LTRVAQLINFANSAGLKAIVNIHHDGSPDNWLSIKKAAADPEYNTQVKATLKALWTQIATRFADKGDFLYFEGMNEIQDGGWGWGDNRTDGGKQYSIMNEWLQIFVDAVRAAGGENANRWLCVPTYTTNIDLGDYLVLPNDPANKLIVAVHCYEPYLYTLEDKYSEWGHTAKSGEAKNGEKQVVAELDKITKKWISKGIPAYIGEFGCVHRSTERAEAFRKYYLEYFVKAAADRNIPVVYWDNGSKGSGRECSGLFERATGEYVNNGADITYIFRKAWNNGDPAYTLQSVYDSAPE
ncbi:MAG: glycoside hydrolase family 5 protein, partial [Muribaculaceae bacterium]|nr:glycoside hydrolase family 5 protein [Muribaculaceae bacterium]